MRNLIFTLSEHSVVCVTHGLSLIQQINFNPSPVLVFIWTSSKPLCPLAFCSHKIIYISRDVNFVQNTFSFQNIIFDIQHHFLSLTWEPIKKISQPPPNQIESQALLPLPLPILIWDTR